ncbi:hypothetical protein MES4922_160222 [Mesorhizobium ventifaucium]|uniref:Transposase DDE domain-containing protein n=1 Tax=Mesorhizobium ventifaucium TaxID=666020 RepID=A0ABN8JFH6_9HYPH|nr:hypothetical protein MES4922_160222 [Mesorhizobium ventifaucium]
MIFWARSLGIAAAVNSKYIVQAFGLIRRLLIASSPGELSAPKAETESRTIAKADGIARSCRPR